MTSTTTPQVTPAEHADTAAEAIRAINHATVRHGPISPQEVASTVGSLSLLSHRLDQACTQLARTLTRAVTTHDLYDDTGANPTDTVAIAADHLRQAAAFVQRLAHHLDQAHQYASQVGHHCLDSTTDDDTNTGHTVDPDPSTADPVLW